MRIAIGQLWQETNTFNTIPTTAQDFENFGLLRGPALVERMRDTNELGGFIQSLNSWPESPEIVGLVRLAAWPGGRATAETLRWLRDEMLGTLTAQMPVDGILLALHGSLAADGTDDVEGEVLEAVRESVGSAIPVVATLDLHANVTQRMIEAADALVLYHTIPHIDLFETGQRAAQLLRRILIDGARPVTAWQKLPLVVPAEAANSQDPGSVSYGLKHRFQQLESTPGMLAAGLATVQPWLDVPELGTAVVVVAAGDADLARRHCAALAADVWQRRLDYLPTLVPMAEGVRLAHENAEGLVVLADSADATTSGAPGDSTWILQELLKYDWPRPALVAMVDPETVTLAQERGVGSTGNITLGGKRDRRFSRPLSFSAEVATLFHAQFVLSGHLGRNLAIDMGPAAVLRHGNIYVLVTSRSGPHFAPEFFQCAGLDPFAASVLVAKSPCGFRAAYQEKAQQIHVVRAPGCAPSDFWRYEYHNIDRPLWLWDEIATWTPEPKVVPTKFIGRTGSRRS